MDKGEGESRKTYYDILTERLEEINKLRDSETQIDFEYVAKHLGYASDTRHFKHTLKTNTTPIRVLALLHLSFNFPLNDLDIKNKIFTEFSPAPAHLSDFLNLRIQKSNVEEVNEFKRKYPKTFLPHIQKTRANLWFYEYLASDGEGMTYYRDAHKEHYTLIENHLESHKEIDYLRILALPIETHLNLQTLGKNGKEEMTHKIKEAIKLCSFHTFEHFATCFKNYNEQFRLFVTKAPTRLYSYAIFDDRYVISEFFRYNQLQRIRPGMLFINEIVTKKLQLLHDEYNFEMGSFITSDRSLGYPLRRSLFIDYADAAYNDIKRDLSIINDKLKNLSNKSPTEKFEINEEKDRLEKKLNEMEQKIMRCKEILKD